MRTKNNSSILYPDTFRIILSKISRGRRKVSIDRFVEHVRLSTDELEVSSAIID